MVPIASGSNVQAAPLMVINLLVFRYYLWFQSEHIYIYMYSEDFAIINFTFESILESLSLASVARESFAWAKLSTLMVK